MLLLFFLHCFPSSLTSFLPVKNPEKLHILWLKIEKMSQKCVFLPVL